MMTQRQRASTFCYVARDHESFGQEFLHSVFPGGSSWGHLQPGHTPVFGQPFAERIINHLAPAIVGYLVSASNPAGHQEQWRQG